MCARDAPSVSQTGRRLSRFNGSVICWAGPDRKLCCHVGDLIKSRMPSLIAFAASSLELPEPVNECGFV